MLTVRFHQDVNMDFRKVDLVTLIVGAAIGVIFASFVKPLFDWVYTKTSNGVYLLRHLKKHKCGHISWSYVTLGNGETECGKCHQARITGKVE
jgi:hypothetical protein